MQNIEQPSQTFSLNQLRSGQACRVAQIGGNSVMRRRLMDLGLLPYAEITLIRVAPLNDPIELRIGNAFISLRREEAALIEVYPL